MDDNQHKMREALEWLLGFGYSTTDGGFHMPDAKMVRNKIEAALSAPARQCDVGTPEEQAERFAKYCDRFHRCNGFPCCGKMKYNRCEFIWAQTPYAEEEGGAE